MSAPGRRPPTQTQRVSRAREIRRHLQLYVSWQSGYMREYLRDQGSDPEEVSLDQLVLARGKLDALIADLALGEAER